MSNMFLLVSFPPHLKRCPSLWSSCECGDVLNSSEKKRIDWILLAKLCLLPFHFYEQLQTMRDGWICPASQFRLPALTRICWVSLQLQDPRSPWFSFLILGFFAESILSPSLLSPSPSPVCSMEEVQSHHRAPQVPFQREKKGLQHCNDARREREES